MRWVEPVPHLPGSQTRIKKDQMFVVLAFENLGHLKLIPNVLKQDNQVHRQIGKQ